MNVTTRLVIGNLLKKADPVAKSVISAFYSSLPF